MNKILVTGVSGQVGGELLKTLTGFGEVIGVDRATLDLANGEEIRQVIADIKPNIIVNPGAYTAVDKAESERELAFAINATAPKIMAEEAAKLGAILLHVSTDYVFDGQKNGAYTEEDPTCSLGIYGESKLLGEHGIEKTEADYLILRTAWVYNAYGKGNFVKTMLRLGAEREELKVVADQIGTPTWAVDIALAITRLLQKTTEPEGESLLRQIYHFTNSGVTSWYDFAVAIFEEAALLGFPLKVKRVIPINTSQYPTPAKRPAMSVLSTRKLVSVLENYPPHWRVSLRQMLKQLQAQT